MLNRYLKEATGKATGEATGLTPAQYCRQESM